MISFSKGQQVILSDSIVTETVDLSSTFAPYGPPGLLWNMMHDGKCLSSAVPMVGSGENGTMEFLFCLQESQEDLLASGTSFWMAHLYGCTADGQTQLYDFFPFMLYYDAANKKHEYRIVCSTHYGSNQTTGVILITSGLALAEGVVYRVSLTWEHTGGSPGTTTFTLYINGTSAATGSSTGWLTHDASTQIANYFQANYQPYLPIGELYIADHRFWSSVRSAGNIDTYKFQRLGGSESGLQQYWKLDDGSGTNANDSTSNNYDGTLSVVNTLPAWGVCITDWLGTYNGSGTHGNQTVAYRYFTGRIDNIKQEKTGPSSFDTIISCVDYGGRLDERIICATGQSKLAGAILKSYIPKYFQDEQIGVRTVSDGATVVFSRWQFDKARKMLDDLKQYSAFVWYVDAYKELRFHDPFVKAAPFNIDNSNPATSGYPMDFEVLDEVGQYANRILARGSLTDLDGQTQYLLFIAQVDSVIAAKKAAEGGSGIYELFMDLTTVNSIDHGKMLAIGALTEALLVGPGIAYTSRYDHGLRVGQTQHVKHTDYGVDDDYIIVGLEFKLAGGVDHQYKVTLGSSRAFFELGSQLRDLVESKSNFKPAGVTQIVAVNTSGIVLNPGP